MRFYVSGGGTGGHFFPALAFLECLIKRGFPALFVGSKRGIEHRLREKVPTESLFLEAKPFMGRSFMEKLRALLSLSSSSLSLYRRLDPTGISVVFGGYASLPLGLSSLLKSLDLFLHEQNSVPSQTNRLLSRFARRVFITFEGSRKYFPQEKVVKTGLPVRKALLEGLKLSRQTALDELGLEDKPTLLVVGGSQGAEFLNRLALEIFQKTGLQGIHITGEREFQKVSDFYKEKGLKVLTLAFSHRMELIYRASTVAVSRAGASTITELSLYGVPALFIPFPHAVHDHQYYNAKEIEELGGGLVARQEEATSEKVIKAVDRLIQFREEFSKHMSSFANPLACDDMINYILNEGR